MRVKFWRAAVIRLSVLGLATLLALGAAELFLIATQIYAKPAATFVPGAGARYMPNAYYRHTREGFSEGYFNSAGFRDRERSIDKPPGTYRIAIFGDSFVEALQVDLEDTFPALLEKQLNAEFPDGPRIEVLSFGQSGFGTSDSMMRYVNSGAAYAPDLVILAFLTWNDFSDNHKGMSPGDVRFFHRFDEKGELVLDASRIDGYEHSLTWPKRTWQALRRSSYLLSMLGERMYYERRVRERSHMVSDTAEGEAPAGPIPLSRKNPLNLCRDDADPAWDEAFEITRAVLLEFDREVRRNGSEFAVVSLSSTSQVHPSVAEGLDRKYGRKFDYGRPDRFLEEWMAEAGIPFLKLYPTLREYHLRTGEYLHGFGDDHGGHWNEAGHRVAAGGIAQFLEERWAAGGGPRIRLQRNTDVAATTAEAGFVPDGP